PSCFNTLSTGSSAAPCGASSAPTNATRAKLQSIRFIWVSFRQMTGYIHGGVRIKSVRQKRRPAGRQPAAVRIVVKERLRGRVPDDNRPSAAINLPAQGKICASRRCVNKICARKKRRAQNLSVHVAKFNAREH